MLCLFFKFLLFRNLPIRKTKK
uniref:Uncharacterized protein n=1 Tax=Anguilla anguilla TaxID=7936 RepID=A0A0E9PCB2_ANGAN